MKLNKDKVKKEKIKKERPKKIKEPKQPKLKTEVPKLEKEVTWEYAYDADLTIGETKISNVAKVILILLILALIGTGIFGYLKRDYISDYIKQPAIVLSTNEVTLEVGDEFDYKDYLTDVEYLDRWTLTYPDNKEVDTSKLGDYTVQYKLQSLANETSSDLVVHVKDSTPPEITLTETLIKLERGEQTEKFNAKDYIKSVTDNYDKEKDIEVIFTEGIDWTKDTVEVNYSATDKSNNKSNATLSIAVNDPPKEPEVVYVEVEVPVESSTSSGSSSSSGSSNSGNSSSSSSSSSGGSSQSSSGSSSNNTPPPAANHYINGVHNFTVKVGDLSGFTAEVQSGISSDETISVDYSSVNLSIPGSYTVTYSTAHVTKTATVTVVE